jgi:prepilin-type N-terminal cleavage/methylation domain-containing protein
MCATNARRGVSLLEVLIVVAILGVLGAITASAVMRVRVEADRVKSANNLRQIIFGVHQLADQRMGKVTNLSKAHMPKKLGSYSEQALMWSILPWTHHQRSVSANSTPSQMADFFHPDVAVYKSPADPTLHLNPVFERMKGKCSYALNMVAADGGIILPMTFADGMTNTVCASESFYLKQDPEYYYDYTNIFGPTNPNEPYGRRRATFADAGWNDAVPVTMNSSTTCSVPGLTFQVNPSLTELDFRIPQTPFAAGLPVAMFDGSVRTLSPRIAETVFWSLVTPAGGEVVGEF